MIAASDEAVIPPSEGQADFKSRDVVLTFHLGLALRLMYARDRDVPVRPEVAHLLPGSWPEDETAPKGADFGMKTVEHLLGVFTAARLRHDVANARCADCGSYRMAAGVCQRCGWIDRFHESQGFRRQ